MTKEQLDAIRARQVRAKKAFTTIQLSLMDIPAMLDEITELKAENARLRKRCEAAVGDLRAMEIDAMCKVCKSKCNYSPSHFAGCGLFEWRGQEGESDANDK